MSTSEQVSAWLQVWMLRDSMCCARRHVVSDHGNGREASVDVARAQLCKRLAQRT